MKVKCIESKCDWFTQGRKYAAQVDEDGVIAILQDDMCSDLCDNDDAWYAHKARLRGIVGDVYTINGFRPFQRLAAFEVVNDE